MAHQWNLTRRSIRPLHCRTVRQLGRRSRHLLGRIMMAVILGGSLVTPLVVASQVEAAPAVSQDAPRRLYDRVMEEFRQRDYDAALAGFRLFLELHGKSGLAPSARYWMGECQYRLGHYDQAMETFSSLVSYYPSNPKMAATTLKIGLTHTKMGQPQEARITFQRVVTEWPETMEADVARKELSKFDPTGDRDPDATQ
ncbi:MAG: tol-pal system protein YbgF [Nitrospiraceae bacterium]